MKLRMMSLLLLLALAAAACAAPPTPAATAVPPTVVPVEPTAAPTAMPAPPTAEPTMPPAPTEAPTDAPTLAPTQPAATAMPPEMAGDAAKGAALWPTKSCVGCHGPNAEGALGPKIAGIDDSFRDVLERVRKGKEEMPPFTAAQISDEEVMNIYAWLQTLK